MGLLSTIIGLGGTVFDSISSRKQYKSEQRFNADQAQLNRDFQREERELAQEFNVNMWNMNNEYNSMSRQVQRAIDAGVNPNALFTSGAHSAVSSPVTTSPMSGSLASSPGSLASSYIGRSAQLSNVIAQNELLENQAEGQDLSNKFDKRTFEQRVKRIEVETNDILSQTEFRSVDKDIKQKTYEWFALQSEADLKLKGEQLNELRNKIILLGEQVESENIAQQGMQLDNQGKALDNQGKALDNQGKAFSNAILQDESILKDMEVEVSRILGIPVGTPEFDAQMILFKQGLWNDLAEATAITNTTQFGQTSRLVSNVAKGALASIVNGIESLFKSFFTH